jgi:hypothetical protein
MLAKHKPLPKSGYARLRDWRLRKRNGQALATVVYDGRVLTLLLHSGWLREEDAHDRNRIGAAITAMLADAAKNIL